MCKTYKGGLSVGRIAITTATAREKKNREVREALEKAWAYYGGLKAVDWQASCRMCLQDRQQEAAKKYILSRGFEPWVLDLCKCKFDYRADYPLIFPLVDNGGFRGWVARTISKREPKYLYNPGLVKNACLVGDYGGGKTALIVEGYLDRLKVLQAGYYKNVIAILGCFLSERQAEKLRAAGIVNIICALDNDEAGERGYLKVKQKFRTYRFRYPPGVKDLGELEGKRLKSVIALNLQLSQEALNNGDFKQD